MQERRARNPKLQSESKPYSSSIRDVFSALLKFVICFGYGIGAGLTVFILLEISAALQHLFGLEIKFLERIWDGEGDWLVLGSTFACVVIGLVVGIAYAVYIIVDSVNYHRRIAESNKKVESDNRNLVAISEASIPRIQKQINTARSVYSQTEARLKQAYGLGVIHPKYRNLVAVARFYEYFDTGRCNALQGHEGAYNIYETEIRLDKIITDLDDIKNQLEQIRANQYTIYQAVKEGVNISNRISNVIADCNNRLANIESNSEVSAYYSKITAENTTFDLWYKWLNN